MKHIRLFLNEFGIEKSHPYSFNGMQDHDLILYGLI